MILFLNATKDNVCYGNAVLAMLFNLPYIDHFIARLKALNPKHDSTTGLFVELYEKSKNIEKLSCKKLIQSLGFFVIGDFVVMAVRSICCCCGGGSSSSRTVFGSWCCCRGRG